MARACARAKSLLLTIIKHLTVHIQLAVNHGKCSDYSSSDSSEEDWHHWKWCGWTKYVCVTCNNNNNAKTEFEAESC